MLSRLLGALALALVVIAGPASAYAGVVTSTATPVAIAPASAPVSPRIGYVYAAGGNSSGIGIEVYAQQANGSLTPLQHVATDSGDQQLSLVHLRAGVALYDLTLHSLRAYHVNAVTGLLTAFAIPKPTSLVSAYFGLAAYDPLAHGLPGQPMLFTGGCGGAGFSTVHMCFQWFPVNATTGALSPSKIGRVSSYFMGNARFVGDGKGRFAGGLYDDAGHSVLVEFQAKVVGGVTAPYGVLSRMLYFSTSPTDPKYYSMGSTIVITSAAQVQFPAGPLYRISDLPGGWMSDGFGASTALPDEERLDSPASMAAGVGGLSASASTQGRNYVFLGEGTGDEFDLPAGQCAIEGVHPVNLGSGLSHARTLIPCPSGASSFVNSMHAQAGYIYAGMYPGGMLSFHDAGTPYLTSTAQKSLPNGGQIYSWSGFLFGNPTVTVPATLSLKTGVPVTIRCPQTCSGSTSAYVTISGYSTKHSVSGRVFKSHAAGSFTLTMSASTSLRTTLAAAIKAHRTLTVVTTTKVVAGIHSVTVVKVSHMHA